MLTITLDWLAMTFKEWTRETQTFIYGYASSPTVVPSTARNGYTAATTDQNGVQVMWNSDRGEMGHHVIFAGSALRNIFERHGISSEAILRAATHAGGSITRLDLAKDYQGGEINLARVWEALNNHASSGTARSFGKIESNNGGFTIYVGSRQSEKFVRIYDKAAESKLSGELWFRFEIETKGMVARAVAVSLRHSDNWGAVFDSIVFGMVGKPEELYLENFFSDRNIPIGLPKIERHSDTEAWIETQVIPAVAKHFIGNPHSEAIKRLRETLDLIDKQHRD
jgi:Replication initiation factor